MLDAVIRFRDRLIGIQCLRVKIQPDIESRVNGVFHIVIKIVIFADTAGSAVTAKTDADNHIGNAERLKLIEIDEPVVFGNIKHILNLGRSKDAVMRVCLFVKLRYGSEI